MRICEHDKLILCKRVLNISLYFKVIRAWNFRWKFSNTINNLDQSFNIMDMINDYQG